MLLLGGMAVAPAQAAPATEAHSLQCMIASAELARDGDDSTDQFVGLMGSMFFAGQVFGTHPDIDLLAAMKREAAKLTPADLRKLQADCSAEVQQRGAQIHDAGPAVQPTPEKH